MSFVTLAGNAVRSAWSAKRTRPVPASTAIALR